MNKEAEGVYADAAVGAGSDAVVADDTTVDTLVGACVDVGVADDTTVGTGVGADVAAVSAGVDTGAAVGADVDAVDAQRRSEMSSDLHFQHDNALAATDAYAESSPQNSAAAQDEVVTYVRSEKKVGRNEHCPCGSGKKYKSCHGQL